MTTAATLATQARDTPAGFQDASVPPDPLLTPLGKTGATTLRASSWTTTAIRNFFTLLAYLLTTTGVSAFSRSSGIVQGELLEATEAIDVWLKVCFGFNLTDLWTANWRLAFF